MNTHNEFREFLRLLQEQKCEFVVVGGYAVAFHGYIRATQDIDVFFRNSPENVAALRAALDAFGLPTSEDQRQDFSAPGSILRMGDDATGCSASRRAPSSPRVTVTSTGAAPPRRGAELGLRAASVPAGTACRATRLSPRRR